MDRVYPFAALLYIGSDYNFRYYGGACMSHFFSDGYWKINNDTLILNSIKPESCFFIRNFGADWFLRDDDGRILRDDAGRAIMRTTIEDCTPIYPWARTDFLVFENEKFIIEDSILVHIRKQHHCIDERNDFTREWNYHGIRVEKWYNWEKWINQIDEEKWYNWEELTNRQH